MDTKAATVQTAPEKQLLSVSANWIISFRDDLLWIIGSVISSYVFLLFYLLAGVPALILILVWVLLFDGPHIFGTVSRTFLDPEMRVRCRKILYSSLVLFVIGPAMAVLPGLIAPFTPGHPWLVFLSENSSVTFIFLASMWAYHHIAMQHYGFMMLYKRKNDDLHAADNSADRFFLLAMLGYPFVRYMLRVPEARDMWPIVPGVGISNVMEIAALAVAIAAAIAFLWRHFQKVIHGQAVDLAKLLFLGAVIPMHWIVLLSSLPPRVMVPILTVSHNIQYHRLIWLHNRNKYRGECARTQYGPAALISRNFFIYYLLGILFAVYRLPNAFSDSDLLIGFLWGFSLVHYYLDGKIWRVRENPELKFYLRLVPTSPGSQGSAVLTGMPETKLN